MFNPGKEAKMGERNNNKLATFLTIFFSITVNFFLLSFLVGAPWPHIFGGSDSAKVTNLVESPQEPVRNNIVINSSASPTPEPVIETPKEEPKVVRAVTRISAAKPKLAKSHTSAPVKSDEKAQTSEENQDMQVTLHPAKPGSKEEVTQETPVKSEQTPGKAQQVAGVVSEDSKTEAASPEANPANPEPAAQTVIEEAE